ncbi:MAG: PAS domain S-box protein [bacterium]
MLRNVSAATPDWVEEDRPGPLPPEICSRPFRRHDQAVIEAQQAIEVVEESCTPIGGIRHGKLANKFPFHAEDGTRFVGGLAVDISERVRAEQGLRDRENQLRAFLDAATDAIVAVEPDSAIDSVNPATERLFGYWRRRVAGTGSVALLAERFPRGGAAAPARRAAARTEIVEQAQG